MKTRMGKKLNEIGDVNGHPSLISPIVIPTSKTKQTNWSFIDLKSVEQQMLGITTLINQLANYEISTSPTLINLNKPVSQV